MTKVEKFAGSFAGDKDAAARIRDEHLRPSLARGRTVVLDFEGVEIATQSFVHALLAAVVRESPENLERIDFRNCSSDVKAMVEIVVEYAQEEF